MKPKPVTYYVYTVQDTPTPSLATWPKRKDAVKERKYLISNSALDCGPVSRIEVPAPVKARKERKS